MRNGGLKGVSKCEVLEGVSVVMNEMSNNEGSHITTGLRFVIT